MRKCIFECRIFHQRKGRYELCFLLKKTLKTTILEHKLVFCLFCVCQMISIFSVIFVAGVFAAYEEANSSYDLEYRQFVVENEHSYTAKQIREQYHAIAQEIPSLENGVLWMKNNGMDVKANIVYQKPSDLYISLGRYFKTTKNFKNVYEILVNQGFTETDNHYKVNDTITVFGKEFRVIGTILDASSDPYFEIPFNEIVEKTEIKNIVFRLDHIPDRKDISRYTKMIENYYGKGNVIEPNQLPEGRIFENFFRNISTLFISLLSILNFSFLYYYLLTKRKRQYSIYRLCGCSSVKGGSLLLLELIVLSFVLFLICSIIFHTCFAWIYPFMGNEITYSLTLIDYTETALIYLFNIMLVFVPIILRYSKKMPMEIYKEE